MNQTQKILAGVVAVVVVVAGGAVAWWLASPLFINRVVEEEFPQGDFEVVIEDGRLISPDPDTIPAMSEAEKEALQAAVDNAAAAMPDKAMDELMPAGEPVPLASGEFLDADSFHQGAGTATIYQLADGAYVLRLENFEVTNGPDLHVILSGSAAPLRSADVMEPFFADLGMIKGNIGSQNYDIPSGTDVTQARSVVIYCVPFGVVFAYAPLS